MNITKKAEQLLYQAFTYNGQCAWSATDTSEGTLPLWGALCLAGLVKERPKSPLGHMFSFEITDKGKELLGSLYSPYSYPYFCRTCRNSFSTEQNLIEHRTRKHSHLVPVFPLHLPERPVRIKNRDAKEDRLDAYGPGSGF